MRTVPLGSLVLYVLTASMSVISTGLDADVQVQADVAAVLRSVREALGGESSLNAVHAVKAVGRLDRVVGPVRLTGEVELRFARPDRYLRIDRVILGRLSAEIATGFNRTALIQRGRGPDGQRFAPAASTPADTAASLERSTLASLKQDASLLWLGLFCDSFDARSLRFGYAGEAVSADQTGLALDVAGEGFTARLFIDVRTHLPLFVSWQAPDVLAAARAAADTQAAPNAPVDPLRLLAQMPSVEHRLYFGDYRPVGRVRWPFRIRRSVDGHAHEELTLDRFILNPADGAAFEAGR